MKRGSTEIETLHLNGWGIGDILEGDEGFGPSRILITAMGQEKFICKWNYLKGNGWEKESGNTTLTCRDWIKVGEDEDLKRRAGFWGRVAANMLTKIKHLEHQVSRT